jgi:hypothetical protein
MQYIVLSSVTAEPRAVTVVVGTSNCIKIFVSPYGAAVQRGPGPHS